jgi:hypothetical protein
MDNVAREILKTLKETNEKISSLEDFILSNFNDLKEIITQKNNDKKIHNQNIADAKTLFVNNFDHLRLAQIAEREADKGLVWDGPDSEAHKYLEFMFPELKQNPPDRNLTHDQYYPFCAAFVMWCLNEAGFPTHETWKAPFSESHLPRTSVYGLKQFMRKVGNLYNLATWKINPRPGDIYFLRKYNSHRERELVHVGIVVDVDSSHNFIIGAEGNTTVRGKKRCVAMVKRKITHRIHSWGRINMKQTLKTIDKTTEPLPMEG